MNTAKPPQPPAKRQKGHKLSPTILLAMSCRSAPEAGPSEPQTLPAEVQGATPAPAETPNEPKPVAEDGVRWLRERDPEGALHLVESTNDIVYVVDGNFYLTHGNSHGNGTLVAGDGSALCAVDFGKQKGCPNAGAFWRNPQIADLATGKHLGDCASGNMHPCGGDGLYVCCQITDRPLRPIHPGIRRPPLAGKMHQYAALDDSLKPLPYEGRLLRAGELVYPELFTQYADRSPENADQIIVLRLDEGRPSTIWKKPFQSWTVHRASHTALVLDAQGVLWRASKALCSPQKIAEVYTAKDYKISTIRGRGLSCATSEAFYMMIATEDGAAGEPAEVHHRIFRQSLEPTAPSEQIRDSQHVITSISCGTQGDQVAWVEDHDPRSPAEQREGRLPTFHLVVPGKERPSATPPGG